MGKRAGRKRSVIVRRQPNGQRARPRQSVEEATMQVVLAQRARRVGKTDARDQKAGSALGRLCLIGRESGISEEQYQAGLRYAETASRYGSVMGFDMGSPKSPTPLLSGGSSCAAEMDDERILAVRRAYRDMMRSVLDLCRHGIECGPILSLLRAICVRDEDESRLSPEDIGNLRLGLNALHRHFFPPRTRKFLDGSVDVVQRTQLMQAE